MKIIKKYKNIRNQIDFGLRSTFSIHRPIDAGYNEPALHTELKMELHDFLIGFDWEKYTSPHSESKTIVDIGTRIFLTAEPLFQVFSFLKRQPKIHGVEIDCNRRVEGLKTRRSFGNYYAQRVPDAKYHGMDFLDWEGPMDIAVLLNPFVSELPHLAWGLPLSKLRPEQLFDHLVHRLTPDGLVLLSNPSIAEQESSLQFLKSHGFTVLQKFNWYPTKTSAHKKPRYGVLLRKPK